MVEAYLNAWVHFKTAKDAQDASDFDGQETFIKIWKASDFDLIKFSNYQLNKIDKLLKQLFARAFPTHLRETIEQKALSIMAMRKNDAISDDDWSQFGAQLMIAWIVAISQKGGNPDGKSTKPQGQSDSIATTTQCIQAERAAKQDSDNGGPGNVLRRVPWESELLQSLLSPIDEYALEPLKLRDKKPPVSEREPWMSVDMCVSILKGVEFEDGFREKIEALVGMTEGMRIGGGENTEGLVVKMWRWRAE